MSSIEELQHLKISLNILKSATNNFSEVNCIGHGGFGKVYKGEILLSDVLTMVAVKRLDKSFGQGATEFWKEIMLLSQYKHENLVSLLHFCDEGGENLLVYEYLSNKSLDLYLSSVDLSWHQRLMICLGAAIGLEYLHEPVEGSQQRVLHRDIKSANILLDHNWTPKIADFGLSKLGPANQQFTFIISDAVGTMGYCDPLYAHTGLLTKESDVYSFGVVLFEVLCGRPCVQNYDDTRRYLSALSRKCYEEKKLDTIIHIGLRDKISPMCVEKFSAIAYQCLELDHTKRPTMGEVVKELRCAIHYQSTLQGVPLKEIQVATDNFRICIDKTLDGERIYEGELSIFGIPTRVFIKRFFEHSGLTLSDYLKSMDILSQLHHSNYISTLGYCIEKREIIVYEYPKRGSLDQYIRRSDRASTSLTWQQRLEICAGAAHGLAYLHSQNKIEIGFKSTSIFLDDKWVAKIGLGGGGDAYNSPEYITNNGKETKKGNVYTFGMVLFEVLCGRLFTEDVDDYTLSAKRIKRLYEKKRIYEIVDPALSSEEKISSSSVEKYSTIAYQCLSYNPRKRPSMDDVVKDLDELLSILSSIHHQSIVQELALKEIQVATHYFKYCIGQKPGGERVYEGELSILGIPTMVYIIRYPEHPHTGDYLEDLGDSIKLQHPNVFSALGYCIDKREEIMVYEYTQRGSLDQYIRRSNRASTSLTWRQRLEICTGAAHGLSFLHSQDECELEFKSSCILLDDKWVAKIGDLEISTQASTDLDINAYESPEYIIDDEITEENNVYNFGIILFEALCGRLCTEEVDGYMLSAQRMKDLYEKKKLYKFVDPVLKKEKISSSFVEKYSAIAYRCLSYDPKQRPSMYDVEIQLEELLDIERSIYQQGIIQEVPLKEIQVATHYFKFCIGKTNYGEWIYEGELSIFGTPTRVYIIRYSEHAGSYLDDLGDSIKLQHPNVFSALCYCNEKREEIIVYEYPKRGNLDHCILLDDKWVAKVSDLEISPLQDSTDSDTDSDSEDDAYEAPESIIDGEDTKENNVYTFGIILFEALCGRLCTEEVDGYMLSAKQMRDLYEKKKLNKFVDPVLKQKKISTTTVRTYATIAYRCLSHNPKKRPSMDDVAIQLEELLENKSFLFMLEKPAWSIFKVGVGACGTAGQVGAGVSLLMGQKADELARILHPFSSPYESIKGPSVIF
uniref:uncharacterized protein LOC122583647 n=1 Tax=Erigeron canadensis TaxID=72917 RepID=UPI001CB88E9F|nr:uncharacterized protein LOC122583647 [Erigeron canadensis]